MRGTLPQMEAWIGLADRQLDVLAGQKAELEATIADLRALRDQTAETLAAGSPGPA